MSAPSGLVPVHPLGPVTAASLTTIWRGAVRVTVVVKATFAFAPGAEMPLVAPAEIVRGDAYMGNNPTRSVHASSDLSPHLARAEVLFRGHAHAPGGAPVARMMVRLGLAGDRGVVLDKSLGVLGDRTLPADAPAPFTKMRLGYERTAGGPEDPRNPIGVGFTGGLPNVIYPDPARASEPAGLGPLAAMWRVRKALLRGHPRLAFEGGPVALPDDLDWSYFQAAPPDQRLQELPDRAWILLEGLHPEHPSLRMRLPHLLASARLYVASREETTIGLRADTLVIDGEAERCTVTWRGSFPIASLEALPELVIAGGVHGAGQPLAWPATPPEPQVPRAAPAPARSLGETALADPSSPPVAALPFHAAVAPGEAWIAPPARQAAPPRVPAATSAMDLSSFVAAALPFQGSGSAKRSPEEETVDEDPALLSGTAVPFQPAAAHAGARATAPAIPGAPWSGIPVSPPPHEAPDLGGTMVFNVPLPVPQSAPAPAMVPMPAMVAMPAMVPPGMVFDAARDHEAKPDAPALVSAEVPSLARPAAAPPAPAPAPPPPPDRSPPPRVVEAPAERPAPRMPDPAPARPAAHAAPPAPPPPPPIVPTPRVPVPAAASKKAYGKFGPNR